MSSFRCEHCGSEIISGEPVTAESDIADLRRQIINLETTLIYVHSPWPELDKKLSELRAELERRESEQ